MVSRPDGRPFTERCEQLHAKAYVWTTGNDRTVVLCIHACRQCRQHGLAPILCWLRKSLEYALAVRWWQCARCCCL